MAKKHWRNRIALLDPETDYVEIYRIVSTFEFPWDFNQSLSFALFRTYAVPSVGRLLDETGQFTGDCQKRYDDTALLLEAPLLHGFDSTDGKVATRRINQMHAMYDISNDDMRYVLSTFVVVPKRWIDDYGWRRLTDAELRASVNYYRELGRRMAIKDVPDTYEGFERLMDDYEAEHFAFDAGARRVADATLDLMVSFYPSVASAAVRRFSLALMDEPLREAFRYPDPGVAVTRASVAAMRARARVVALLPSRRKPQYVRDSPRIRTYSGPLDLASMGTFRGGGVGRGCPVPHGRAADAAPETASA